MPPSCQPPRIQPRALLSCLKNGQLPDEARRERVRAVETRPAVHALDVGRRERARRFFLVVLGAGERVGGRDQEAVLEAPVELGLQRVVARVGRQPREHVRGAAVELVVGPAGVVGPQGHAGVDVVVGQQDAAPDVADVGDLAHQVPGQLPLQRDVPAVELGFLEVGLDVEELRRAKLRDVRVHDPARRDVEEVRRPEAGGHAASGCEAVRRVELVRLLDGEVVGVAVVGERDDRGAETRPQHGLLVEAVGRSQPRCEVRPGALHADVLGNAPIARDLDRVVGDVVVREPALVLDAHERRVVLPAQPEVDGQLRSHLPLVLDEGEHRPMLRAGAVDDLDVALDLPGHVEQERRKGVGEAGRGRGVARDRGLGASKVELAPHAARVLDLEQEVLVVANLGPDLESCGCRSPW